MKQILKFTIGCFAIFCFVQGKSQSYVRTFPEYIDKYVTDKIIDSLRTHHVSNYIIYQTNVDSKIVIDKLLTINDTIEVSYLLWQENGKLKSFIITDSFVYKSISNVEDKTKIFSYPYASQLWIRTDENGVIDGKLIAIIPPIIEPYPYGKNIVVLITPNSKFFFEYGKNTYYQLKVSRDKYRNEFIHLLDSIVPQFNNKWIKTFKNEKRW